MLRDRAVIGGWTRTTEPLLPYTTSTTMNADWCWRIEHESLINAGYVYSSRFITDEEALREFRARNPKVSEARVVKFRSGRYRRMWVENVVAVGNASGFVEPLEATSLMLTCGQCASLCNFLETSRLQPPPTLREVYNTAFTKTWHEIRDFLAIHYQLNTRLDTPFWRHCREDTDLSGISDMLAFYKENGPSLLTEQFLTFRHGPFGSEGFLTMFVGFNTPYSHRYIPSAPEIEKWEQFRSQLRARAQNGLDVREALAYIRDPRWTWFDDAAPQVSAQHASYAIGRNH